MKIGSLFSGIGGLELGLEQAGLGEVLWQAEIDPYCRAVLAEHWPNVEHYEDVRAVDRQARHVDLICGGFPCQPVSVAGARKGKDDARWLWPEYRRIVEAIEPTWVIVENVPGLRTLGLLDVLRDLADLGFDAEWTTLSAAECGAPHLRRRLFLVASHTERSQLRLEPGWLSRACRSGATQLAFDGAQGLVADDTEDGRGPRWSWRSDRSASGTPEQAHGVTSVADAHEVSGQQGSTATDAVRTGHEGTEHESREGSLRGPGSLQTDVAVAADPDAQGEPQPRGAFGEVWGWAGHAGWGEPPPPIRGVDDVLSLRLDSGDDDSRGCEGKTSDGVEAPDAWRIAALGNAVVVECAYVVGRAIAEVAGV